MKKISAFLMGVMALPMTLSAADYTPAAPNPVEYQTCIIQTRTLRDANGDRVTSVGDQGDVRVIGRRLSTGDVYRPCGKITATINNTYDGTKKIANNKLEYRILVLHKGETEAQPYIFDAEDGYIKWEQNDYEPMEWLNNNFTDAYDLGLSLGEGDGPNVHSIYFYAASEDIEKIGVQSRWERSGKIYESEITWADPTTPDLTGVLTWEEWEQLQEEYSTDFTPAAPDPVEYLSCFVQTRTLYDANGNKVTSVGDNGEVKVIGRRESTGGILRPCGKINFTINNTYNNGTKTIENSKLQYRILVRREGEQAKAYIFNAEEGYIKWEQNDYEPMEWINNDFTDSYDFGLSLGAGSEPNVHSIYFFGASENITQIGVQSRWENSGKTYESATTWVDPMTPDLTGVLTWEEWEALNEQYNPSVVIGIANSEVEVEYIDLQGTRVANPEKGLYIVKAIAGDGSVKVSKVMF